MRPIHQAAARNVRSRISGRQAVRTTYNMHTCLERMREYGKEK